MEFRGAGSSSCYGEKKRAGSLPKLEVAAQPRPLSCCFYRGGPAFPKDKSHAFGICMDECKEWPYPQTTDDTATAKFSYLLFDSCILKFRYLLATSIPMLHIALWPWKVSLHNIDITEAWSIQKFSFSPEHTVTISCHLLTPEICFMV